MQKHFMEQWFSKLLPRHTLGEVEVAIQAVVSYDKEVTSYFGCFIASSRVIRTLNPDTEENIAFAPPLLHYATDTHFHR